MRTDVNVFLGSYPFRRVPGTSVAAVLEAMERLKIDQAWVSHLPSLFWKDPAQGNEWLFEIGEMEPRLRPVPAVQPEMVHWEEILSDALENKAPAVRCDPTFYGIDPVGSLMRNLVVACGEMNLPLAMAVRLEDLRQRHPHDVAPDLPPSAVRALVRAHPATRFLITHADRGFIEEVHFGSTPEEAARLTWDICWIWGPPEDHLATLIGTMGAERFAFGTGMPLRIPDNALAKLDLTELTQEQRRMIEGGNAERLTSQGG
ncbi:MAG: amidohydrolase family protein [Gemmatimonadota bacterium]